MTTHNTCTLRVTANTHVTLASYRIRPTPTRHLPFTGHALHPCKSCFRNRFVDFSNGRMYLSKTSAKLIADQGDILHRHPNFLKRKFFSRIDTLEVKYFKNINSLLTSGEDMFITTIENHSFIHIEKAFFSKFIYTLKALDPALFV